MTKSDQIVRIQRCNQMLLVLGVGSATGLVEVQPTVVVVVEVLHQFEGAVGRVSQVPAGQIIRHRVVVGVVPAKIEPGSDAFSTLGHKPFKVKSSSFGLTSISIE